jgi:hypothetical protein
MAEAEVTNSIVNRKGNRMWQRQGLPLAGEKPLRAPSANVLATVREPATN